MLVKTPYTYRAHVPAAGLIAHYTAVADASPVPVLLYNFPASTGVNLAPETVAVLSRHPNIAGMKETSTDGAQFADLSAAVPDDFTVLCGAAPGVFAALCAGATGAIIAVGALLPALCLEPARRRPRRPLRRRSGAAAADHAARARRSRQSMAFPA